MLEGLKQSPALINLRKQYETLSTRDRAALKVLVVALVLVVLVFGVIKPAYQYKVDAERQLLQSQSLLALVNENKSLLASSARQSSGGAASKSLNSQQLVSSVTNMAKRQDVALKRFEPSGEQKIKVWVDNASFDKVIAWLARLKRDLGVKVEQISVDKDDEPGRISARMTLSS